MYTLEEIVEQVQELLLAMDEPRVAEFIEHEHVPDHRIDFLEEYLNGIPNYYRMAREYIRLAYFWENLEGSDHFMRVDWRLWCKSDQPPCGYQLKRLVLSILMRHGLTSAVESLRAMRFEEDVTLNAKYHTAIGEGTWDTKFAIMYLQSRFEWPEDEREFWYNTVAALKQ